MARTVADLALFLDAMSGLCPHDPLTFDAPDVSFSGALLAPGGPQRIAFTADFASEVPVDRETREICAKAVRLFEAIGATVDEAAIDISGISEPFLTLRSQHYVVARGELVRKHRDQIKPDIVWNTERGFAQSPDDLAKAERYRSALFARCAEFFETYDVLVTPGASTPAFDVNRRMPDAIDGKPLENYLGASLITGAISMMGLPAVSVPCGFDQFGRPVGLQLVGRHRGEAELLKAAHLFEQAAQLSSSVPITPRTGTAPGAP